jgi:hypothetical protein
LVILITLVCCYAACWGPTKRQGVDDVWLSVVFLAKTTHPGNPSGPERFNTSVTAPLVVGIDRSHYTPAWNFQTERHYYFWFFGYVAKLPYEREL